MPAERFDVKLQHPSGQFKIRGGVIKTDANRMYSGRPGCLPGKFRFFNAQCFVGEFQVAVDEYHVHIDYQEGEPVWVGKLRETDWLESYLRINGQRVSTGETHQKRGGLEDV